MQKCQKSTNFGLCLPKKKKKSNLKALASRAKKGFVDFQMVATVHTFINDFKPNIIKTHQNSSITSSVVMIERNRCVRIVFYSLGTKIIKIPNKTKWYNWENSKINSFEFPLILKTCNQKINNIGYFLFNMQSNDSQNPKNPKTLKEL